VGWLRWFASFQTPIVRTQGQRARNALNARVNSAVVGSLHGRDGQRDGCAAPKLTSGSTPAARAAKRYWSSHIRFPRVRATFQGVTTRARFRPSSAKWASANVAAL
jgi:hypothetical protein